MRHSLPPSTSRPELTAVDDSGSDEAADSEGGRSGSRSVELRALRCPPSSGREVLLYDGDDQAEEKDAQPGREESRDSFMLYTPDEERAVVRKLDRRLVLFVALLYMLSFLDRSNIGNARIAGLTEDLGLDSGQYEWLLTAFYITYILFEWMTLMYRVLPAHVYVAICVASWGLIASVQCLASSFVAMVVLRALLGIGEAAFGPGVPFYLSGFFKRDELALRTGLFISAAPLATSFAGGLAWAITGAAQHGPIAPWRLLFLVEGFPSVMLAVFAWYHIPDSPGTARFFNRRQKHVARLRLRKETGAETRAGGGKGGLQWREVGQTLVDPKCYMTALMFFGCNVAFSSLPPFLPTIIKEMDWSPLASQALSAPPYVFSFLAVILTAFLSDRCRSRGVFVCLAALVGSAGYALIAIAGHRRWPSAWRYAGVFPAAAGFFSAITLIIAWTLNNQRSASGRGTGMAMINLIGQLGPLVGTRLYPDGDAPYYVRGMSACAGCMAAVAVLALASRLVLRRENERWGARGKYGRVGDGGGEGFANML